MRQWLMRFLGLIETAVVPAPGSHHAITAAQYGSEEHGFEPRLALRLSLASGESLTLFLDDEDFRKPPEVLTAEVARIVASETRRAQGGPVQPGRTRGGPDGGKESFTPSTASVVRTDLMAAGYQGWKMPPPTMARHGTNPAPTSAKPPAPPSPPKPEGPSLASQRMGFGWGRSNL